MKNSENLVSLWEQVNAQGCKEASLNDMSSWYEVEQWDNCRRDDD